jgi:hypothetical protein
MRGSGDYGNCNGLASGSMRQRRAATCGGVRRHATQSRTVTATCGSSPLVTVVVGGWRGRRKRVAATASYGAIAAAMIPTRWSLGAGGGALCSYLRWSTPSILNSLSKTVVGHLADLKEAREVLSWCSVEASSIASSS